MAAALTTKRKRYSKKSKQSWRKNTNIRDVEEHLEDARREERTGGPVSEKPDESLYFLDHRTEERNVTEGKPKENSRKRKLLKADQLLPESKIKPIGSKKRKVHLKSKQREDFSNSSSDSEIEEERGKLVKAQINKKKPKTAAVFDLWEAQDIPTGDEHFLSTTKRINVKKPKTISRKTSQLVAVEVCSPGASYNPTYEDHQSLLQMAHNVELRKVKETEKLKRQVKLLTAEEAANLPTWNEEMSQGLFAENDAEDDENENDHESALAAPVRAFNRKTKQQRTKEKQKQEEVKRLETERKEKRQQNEIFRLKALKKEMKIADEEAEKRRRKKKETERSSSIKPKRLSKHKYESPDCEVQLSTELTGSLRTLKQEGNLFEDRFKSLQRRNIIETRLPVKPYRKYKQKTYTRKSRDRPCIKEI